MNLFLTDIQMKENVLSAGFDIKIIEALFFIETTADINYLYHLAYMRTKKIWFITKGAYSVDMSLAHGHRVNKQTISIWIIIKTLNKA